MRHEFVAASEFRALRTGGAAKAVVQAGIARPGTAIAEPRSASLSHRISIGKRIRSSPANSRASLEPVLRRAAPAPQAALADLPKATADIVRVSDMTAPSHVPPVQWEQAVGLARTSCARLYRDGAGPTDALTRFGLSDATADWDRAVRAIATFLCARPAAA
jgi:hypothetical protein